MSELTIKKLALSFGLFSFGFVVIGSIISGATFYTAFLRGSAAILLFGGAAFGLLSLMVEGKNTEPVPETNKTTESENG
ncbi:MAG: hypothetical protein COV66_12885 [Nitrospinae bacterium CG11_big_fil_rev_8_21_14_0_20_45_15]|nr:MAG: hypothetical protein COV66_12885 [Nitrospinae bacterium CG11_big_fil_rev_8_21_14_0_20_45_15]